MLNFKEPNRTFHSSKHAQDSKKKKKKRLVNVYILVFEFQLNNEVLIFN